MGSMWRWPEMTRAASGVEKESASRPLHHLDGRLSCCGRRGKGACGQAGALRFGGRRVRRLRCGAQACGPVAKLATLTAFGFAQTAAPSQFLSALRAGPQAFRSSPPKRRAPAYPHAPLWTRGRCSTEEPTQSQRGGAASTTTPLVRGKPQTVAARQAVFGRGDFWGGEERRIEVGVRSTHQRLTRCRCLSEAERSERSEFGNATSIRAPQRSRRTRRPPQHEPRPGTACRASLSRRSGQTSPWSQRRAPCTKRHWHATC